MDNSKEILKKLIDDSYEVDIKLGKSLYGRLNSGEISSYLLKNGVYAFPCKVNDPVWENVYSEEGRYRHTLKATVVGFHIGPLPNHTEDQRKEYLIIYSPTYDNTYYRNLDTIEDTLFFSREEADAHKERKND